MRKLFAIVGREWRAYFLSPIGWVILAAFLLINGIIFFFILQILSAPGAGTADALRVLFSNTFFWIYNIFFIPVITMRLVAEERKSGTLEILLTSPVSESAVILGKFAAALGFFLTLWAPTILYIFILRAHTPIDFGLVASSYLGLTLLGAFWIAVGLFASTLTKNQILAAILAFAFLIPIFTAGFWEQIVNDPKKRELVRYFDLWSHVDEFVRGVVDTRRVVYYLTAAALFLFLAVVTLSAKKESP